MLSCSFIRAAWKQANAWLADPEIDASDQADREMHPIVRHRASIMKENFEQDKAHMRGTFQLLREIGQGGVYLPETETYITSVNREIIEDAEQKLNGSVGPVGRLAGNHGVGSNPSSLGFFHWKIEAWIDTTLL